MGCGASSQDSGQGAAQPVPMAKIQKTVAQMNEIVGNAIKMALNDAVEYACTEGVNPGLKSDPETAVKLPPAFETMDGGLRNIGLGGQVDEFVKLLNEAAEQAVPGCQPIIKEGVDSLKINDARELFENKDPTACTTYLKADAKGRGLVEKCREPVKKVLETSTVVNVCNALLSGYNAIPLVTKVEFDLELYVVEACIEGLFVLIARREAAIRADPNITKISAVIDVFGNTTIYHGCTP